MRARFPECCAKQKRSKQVACERPFPSDIEAKMVSLWVTFPRNVSQNVGAASSGSSSRGSTVFAGMDTRTGQLVSIAEWTLQWRHLSRKLDVDDRRQEDRDAAPYIKQVRRRETSQAGAPPGGGHTGAAAQGGRSVFGRNPLPPPQKKKKIQPTWVVVGLLSAGQDGDHSVWTLWFPRGFRSEASSRSSIHWFGSSTNTYCAISPSSTSDPSGK